MRPEINSLMGHEAYEAASVIMAGREDWPSMAVVMGSGWGPAVEQFGPALVTRSMEDLPGFKKPSVEGHAGLISLHEIDGSTIVVFQGRRHRYEFELDDNTCLNAVTHNVKTAHALGCRGIILTNAVGGVNAELRTGDVVVIHDHNDAITAAPSPLRFNTSNDFMSCEEVYDPGLRIVAGQAIRQLGLSSERHGSVYAQVRGPHFETPAVMKFLQRNGVDIVGMSIIQEALMAKRLGMQVLGISLVTDVAGMKVTHQEVQRVVQEKAPQLGELLKTIVANTDI